MVDENTLGRQSITIVEIDQDFCSRVYGVAPCTAALGTTGGTKCFNTLATCQDTANFDKSELTLRFCMASPDFPEPGEFIIPSLINVTSNPTEITIGGSDKDSAPLGRRASVTITFQDHPYNDKLVDSYRSDRDYDPLERGTFWTKWLARNPYHQNRPLRIREGYIGQPIAEMRTRNYIIEKVDGADSNGRVTIVAKDILKLADDKRAQCPLPSTGVLDISITNIGTAITLSPTGVGNLEYPASGTAIIGSELVTYTRIADAVTLTARGLRGSTAEAHDADETFQQVKTYVNERVDDVVIDLLENFANIDSAYIPSATWAAEATSYLSSFTLNTWITEPTGVSTLLSELIQQCIFYIWWDEVNQLIQFRAIKPAIPDETIIRDINQNQHIIAESVQITRDSNQRLSQVWIYFDPFDPTESLTKASNYRRLNISVDQDAETAIQYGESRVKRIFSRWFDDSNGGAALTTAARLLLRYRDNPIYVNFSMDAKDRDVLVGDIIQFTHRNLVDSTGAPRVDILQVVKVHENDPGHRAEYKCQAFGFAVSGFGSRFAYVMANIAPDYTSATDDEKKFGGWICSNDGSFSSDDGDAYRII